MAEQLREGNAEEHAGLRTGHTGQEVFPPHAWIDDHRYGAEFEECESGGNERQSLPDHDEHAIAATNATVCQFVYPRIDFLIQLGERERQVVDCAGRGSAAGNLDRCLIRLTCSHQRQMAGDVGRLSHRAKLAFPSGFGFEQVCLPREQHAFDTGRIARDQHELRAGGDERGIEI